MYLKCSGRDDNTSVVLNNFSSVSTSGATQGLGYFDMQAGAVKDQTTNRPMSRRVAPNPHQASEAVVFMWLVQKKLYCSSLLIDPVR